MASIRQTDTLHNKRFTKGRPAKPDRERHRKRQETYRWRDARRIYLANSFDRWRKLRCSLGMKDSVLAWHLMEAHEKGLCGVCRQSVNDDPEMTQGDQDFLPQLIKAMRSVCVSHLQFEKCLRVVGLLCLEFDNSRKENLNIDETISSKLKSSNECHTFIHHANNNALSSPNVDVPDDCVKLSLSNNVNDDANEFESSSMTVGKREPDILNGDHNQPMTKNDSNEYDVGLRNQSDPGPLNQIPDGHQVTFKQSSFVEPTASVSELNRSCNDDNIVSCNSFMESEMEVSLEIDVERIDTSQEPEELCCQSSVDKQSNSEGIDSVQRTTSSPINSLPSNPMNLHKPSVASSSDCYGERGNATGQSHLSPIHAGSELPLDMSVEKTNILQKMQDTQSPVSRLHLMNELSVDTSCSDQKVIETEPAPKGMGTAPLQSQSSHTSRAKEEAHPSIPWQRRDMSRKEEYEFLELNPFCDLSEFSHRYPHVHQRTYYRWKRRIKEEYIILEQCPSMSFEEFSSVVLQAKISVFNLWKSLIAQGKGFFAPSDASKRLEAKCPLSKSVNTLNEQYTFLQKNMSCTQEQFCQKFLDASPEMFNTLKKKVMQEFWVFYHNSHLDWRDFSKLVEVSEEVYNCWRDHISRDMKSVIGKFPPNPQMISPHGPGFQNAPHPQTHLMKPSIPTVDTSTPEDARNIPNNYISSMQNMIFPWASYYAVHSPINQQLLPMMLWPRMMGLNGGKPSNLMSLPMTSPSSCGSQSESPHQEISVPIQTHLQPHANLDTNILTEEKLKMFSPSQESDSYEYVHGGVKRVSSNVPSESESYEYGHVKKQRMGEDVENMNSQSPINKSRKQNKQEYVYYLKNPSLSFKDLETLFPSISLRTFYRWRKEMNAALLYMRQNKDPNYQEFQLVFPDIPEDVFEVWRTKSGKESFAERILFTQNVQSREDNDHVPKAVEVKTESGYSDKMDVTCHMNSYADKCKEYSSLGEASPSKKQFKTAHLFIHKNPNMDFTAFTKLFPNISARSFYRWKKEWKDAIELLQSNPGLDYERYKSIDSSISEEIFDAWKQFSLGVKPLNKESLDNGHYPFPASNNNEEIADVNNFLVRKHPCHEFTYLQLHSQIEFYEFNSIYPHISKNTFDHWQQEIQQIVTYIKSQPSISFEEISAVLPDVTEEAFLKWKENLSLKESSVGPTEKRNVSTDEIESGMRENDLSLHNKHNTDEAKIQITNALLHLMHKPNIAYQDFSQLFPMITIETFQLWLHRIKNFIQQISSNPNLEFEEFRSVCNEIEEDVFRKWKSLTPEEICAIGNQSGESSCSDSDEMARDSLNDAYRKRALYFCQENPNCNYDLFAEQYYKISETDFKCWMLKISNQMSFIRDNPNMSFRDFNGIYPEVDRAVFDRWRKMSSNSDASIHYVQPSPYDAIKAESPKGSHGMFNTIEKGERDKNILSPEDHKPMNQMYLQDSVKNENHVSSLEKLAQLADRNAPYSYGLNSKMAMDMHVPKDDLYQSHMSTNQSQGLSRECPGDDHQNVPVGNDYGNDYKRHYFDHVKSSVDQALQQRSDLLSSPRISEPYYDDSITTVDKCVEKQDNLPKHENKSLSNLMVMSADHHKFSTVTSVSKVENSIERVSQPLANSDKWNYALTTAASVKDDEEMFSSQRQKKMSRAEYLFVKDNPDVDSQEFSRIFPGVSARTFYRWKKEIKAQMQVA